MNYKNSNDQKQNEPIIYYETCLRYYNMYIVDLEVHIMYYPLRAYFINGDDTNSK